MKIQNISSNILDLLHTETAFYEKELLPGAAEQKGRTSFGFGSRFFYQQDGGYPVGTLLMVNMEGGGLVLHTEGLKDPGRPQLQLLTRREGVE